LRAFFTENGLVVANNRQKHRSDDGDAAATDGCRKLKLSRAPLPCNLPGP
jgi:hypothetical protein